MNNLKYLICLALIEQDHVRAMPLGGKSIQIDDLSKNSLKLAKEKLVLELCLRVFKRSENAHLRQAAGDKSLLLVQMELETMHEKLPALKAEWISNGNSEIFMEKLSCICEKAWSVDFIKHQGVEFRNCFQLPCYDD